MCGRLGGIRVCCNVPECLMYFYRVVHVYLGGMEV